MTEVKKCPKCEGEMERGKSLVSYIAVTLAKQDNLPGDAVFPFYCKGCGYIELYKEVLAPKITRICPKCGYVLTGDAKFCPHCGKSFEPARNKK